MTLLPKLKKSASERAACYPSELTIKTDAVAAPLIYPKKNQGAWNKNCFSSDYRMKIVSATDPPR
jgi:hypothetical protein